MRLGPEQWGIRMLPRWTAAFALVIGFTFSQLVTLNGAAFAQVSGRTAPVQTTRAQVNRSGDAAVLSLSRVVPNRLQAGGIYTLTLAGSGFGAGMTAAFSPPGILVTTPVLVQSPRAAQLRVQVPEDALPGWRSLQVTVTAAASGAGMVALPGQPARALLSQAVEVLPRTAAAAGAPPPAVRAPPDGEQPASLLAPAGSSSVPATMDGDTSPQAAPANRPPVAPATRHVAPPMRLPPPPPARVMRLTPDKLQVGETSVVELQGFGLTGDLLYYFGPGTEVVGTPKLRGTSRAIVTLKVLPGAAVGIRRVAIATGIGARAMEQPAQFSVVTMTAAVSKAALPVPKIAPLDPGSIQKDSIELVEPHWKTQTGSTMPMKDPVTGGWLGKPEPIWSVDPPALREDLLFTWKESNPGLAEWFEIRFYREDKLLATRRIDALPISVGKVKGKLPPTWFRADAALIGMLVPPQQGSAVSTTEGQFAMPAQVQLVGAAKGGAAQPAPEVQVAAMADLYWEVAGFRTYQQNGVVKAAGRGSKPPQVFLASAGGLPPLPGAQPATAQTPLLAGAETTVEVEVSARWPLTTPYRPTGLDCGKDKKSTFDLVNQSKKNFTSNETWDVMRLTGTFSLAGSPYLSKPKVSKPEFMGKVVATTWSFDNVFIDWGDGTQQPLVVGQAGDAGTFESGTQLSLGSAGWTHQYKDAGAFVVRVYQLAGEDVQSGNGGIVSAAIDAQMQDSLYFKVLADDGAGGTTKRLAPGKAAADSAYMLYCQNLTIAPRTDPDAIGPLKLVSIEVQGFPWAAPDTSPVGAFQQVEKKLNTTVESPAASVGAGAAGFASDQPVNVALSQISPALFGTGTGGAPAYSACDVSLTAGAALTYVGQGAARLRWRLGDSVFHEEVYDDIGPSPARADGTLAKDQSQWGPPLPGVRANLLSSPMPLDTVGAREVRVEAEVVYSSKSPQLYTAISQALGAGGKPPDAAAAKAVLLGAQGGPKIGVLSPYQQSAPAMPAVSYVQDALEQVAAIAEPLTVAAANYGGLPPSVPVGDALQKIAGSLVPKKAPPEFVASEPAPYQVVGHDTDLPCTFEFAVSDGSFRVGGLQQGGQPKVKHEGNVFSGTGVLQLPVPGQPGKHIPMPLAFEHWSVAADGFTVEQGKLQTGEVPGGELTAAGLAFRIGKLDGTAQASIEATLTSRLLQANLLDAQSADKPPALATTAATLSPEGDWRASGVSMPEILLYDSGFRLAPQAVDIDLSAATGEAPDGSCSVSGVAWNGVHFGAGAQLTAYDFDLPGSNTGTVGNFGVDAKGLCGAAQLGAFSAKQLKGNFSWDGVKVNAGNGQFKAIYQNLRLKVPWLDVELKGTQDPILTAGEGVGKQQISLNLAGSAPVRKHGAISFQAQSLKLVKEEGMVPAVRSDTRFDFAGENKIFASNVWVADLYFGLDGKAYLAPGTKEATVGLAGQSGAIGAATLTLDDVVVRAPASGAERLAFDFNGKVTISKALEPAKMTVSYAVHEPVDGKYLGVGPLAGNAEPIALTFPKAEGTVKGKISAEYVPPAESAAAAPPGLGWIPAAHAAADPIRFKGSVDLQMFDLPVKADFALGYQGGEDFWAIKAVYDGFGPNGAPLVSPFLNIFELGGGLGFNVSLESLKGKGLQALAYAGSGGVPVFNAATLVGTPDAFTLGVRGDLSIKVAGSAPGTRIDFAAYPLMQASQWTSTAPFEGFLKFQGGSFDGQVWGGMEFFGGKAGVSVPQGAAAFHFGGGDWYAYFGRDTGPRVQGHALFIERDIYLMLSSTKMAMGGSATMEESLGDCDDVCAYVSGIAEAGLGLATAPLKLAGTTAANVKAGGCYDGECAGVGGKVDAYAELPGPVLRYGFSIDLPCPVPDVDVTLKVLPSPGVSPSLDWCDMNPLW